MNEHTAARKAVAHMTTPALYAQLDAAELHDDYTMVAAIDDELTARVMDEHRAGEAEAEYRALYPELPQPWWAFR